MVKTLLKSLREYKKPSILCPIFMASEAAIDIVIPFLMTFVIKELENLAQNAGYSIRRVRLAILLIALLLCAVVALIVGIAGGKLAARASSGLAHNLREDLYAKIQSFSFQNLDRFSTASLTTRVTTDVTNVQTAYQMCLRTIVRTPMMVIVAIIMTCLIEPSVSLLFLAATIFISIIVIFCMTKALPNFKKMFAKYDDLNLVVEEDLTAIRVVKSYVREKREIEKMHDATAAVYAYDVKAEKVLTFMTPFVTWIMFLLNIVVLLTGSVAENLRWGDENATEEELRLAAELAQAEEFVDALPKGFDYDLGQGGVNVSGGQKQRLCIARALLKKPNVIIFDDSTSAVDTKTDALIRDALKKYAPKVTKIIIAQRVSSVQDADKILVMEKGKIVDMGTHKELLRSSEIYRELYLSQMQGNTQGEAI